MPTPLNEILSDYILRRLQRFATPQEVVDGSALEGQISQYSATRRREDGRSAGVSPLQWGIAPIPPFITRISSAIIPQN